MKKLLAFLLVLACVFSLVACGNPGENPPEDPVGGSSDIFEIAAKGSVPTKVVSLTTYMLPADLSGNPITLSGTFTQVSAGANSILDYSYQRFATIEENAPSYIVSPVGAIAVKDGRTKSIGDSMGSWEVVIPSLQKLGAFKLDKKTIPSDYTLSSDGKKLTVSLTAEEALAVIGVPLGGVQGEISLEVQSNGKFISQIIIQYKEASGATTRVASSYTYGAETLDFSRFN